MKLVDIDRLKLLSATQTAAIKCATYIGKGDNIAADKAAVDAMRQVLNSINFRAKIVIGEGERDKAPMLFIGEELGMAKSEYEFEIAVDPLEGTNLCANNSPGAMSVMAISEIGGMLNAPDVYMNKIACKIPVDLEVIDLDQSVLNNLSNLAKYKKCDISDLEVIILDRTRHGEIIAKSREAGAKVKLINDGDIAAVIEVATGNADLYLGIGGAPEGVLAAAALKTLGGQMQCRLQFSTQDEIIYAKNMNITDLNKKYSLHDLVTKNCIFFATGVTSGSILRGVKKINNKWFTDSIIISSASGEYTKINSSFSCN